jgi:predicted metal-dependent HD superfamily phosphohydrolase
MKAFMASTLSSVHHFFIGIPIAIFAVTIGYFMIIWLALSKKDEVEAAAWHHDTGFSIKARNNRRRRLKDE